MNELSVAGRPMPRNAKRRRVALGDRTNQQPAAQPSGPGKAGGKKKQQQKTKKQPKKASAAPLPAGWEAEVSRESGETYYRNTLSDEAQWELPVEPAVDSARIEAQVDAALQELDDSGIRVIACVPRLSACPPAASPAGAWAEKSPRASVGDLKFGKTLGAGAFGTVRQATADLDGERVQVAVKTLEFTDRDDCEEKLEEFKQEATVGWAASSRSRSQVRARPAPRCARPRADSTSRFARRKSPASARPWVSPTTRGRPTSGCTWCWRAWSATVTCTRPSTAANIGSASAAGARTPG